MTILLIFITHVIFIEHILLFIEFLTIRIICLWHVPGNSKIFEAFHFWSNKNFEYEISAIFIIYNLEFGICCDFCENNTYVNLNFSSLSSRFQATHKLATHCVEHIQQFRLDFKWRLVLCRESSYILSFYKTEVLLICFWWISIVRHLSLFQNLCRFRSLSKNIHLRIKCGQSVRWILHFRNAALKSKIVRQFTMHFWMFIVIYCSVVNIVAVYDKQRLIFGGVHSMPYSFVSFLCLLCRRRTWNASKIFGVVFTFVGR